MDLDRPLPPLPQPASHLDDSDYHRQNHHHHARPRDVFDYADDIHTPTPPPSAMAKYARRLARRVERACCVCATYFPLAFVYSLTTWAVYVVVRLATTPDDAANVAWVGSWCAVVAVVLDALLIWSYTTAVFSSPGSTTNDQGYSTIPAALTSGGGGSSGTSLTVKSNGEMRFCKKCQARKPDRAHHCSSCRRCVLKMDHHCPWLANCIGLRNGKAFLLFLIYTTLLSLFTFAVCGAWVWTEIVNDATYSTAGGESLMPVQYIMMCVIGGIIGLVVGLFTSWHLFLACRGQTTIECMEKTRYSSPLRSSMTFTAASTMAEAINDSFGGSGGGGSGGNGGANKKNKPMHDEERALFDGVEGAHDPDDDDDEEGNAGNNGHSSRVAPLVGRRLTYNELERYRAQKRHEAYMDEQDNQKLPHAFDLGVRRNLLHMFGPRPWLWPFPILTTTGDGWTWEPSPKWLAVRDRIRQERDAQLARERAAGWGAVADERDVYARGGESGGRTTSPPPIIVTTATPPRRANPQPTRAPPSRYRRPGQPGLGGPAPTKADRILGRTPGQYADDAHAHAHALHNNNNNNNNNNNSENVSMQRLNAAGRTLPNKGGDDDDLFESEEDEEEEESDDDDESSFDKPAPPPKDTRPDTRPLRAASPLQARWLPDRTSGLLRKVSSVSPSSPSPSSPTSMSMASPLQSPVTEGPAASPLAAAWRGRSQQQQQQPAESVASDADDGSVD